jgi:hypothetical protein
VCAYDELAQAMREGEAFVGFVEGDICFPPTYKCSREVASLEPLARAYSGQARAPVRPVVESLSDLVPHTKAVHQYRRRSVWGRGLAYRVLLSRDRSTGLWR